MSAFLFVLKLLIRLVDGSIVDDYESAGLLFILYAGGDYNRINQETMVPSLRVGFGQQPTVIKGN